MKKSACRVSAAGIALAWMLTGCRTSSPPPPAESSPAPTKPDAPAAAVFGGETLDLAGIRLDVAQAVDNDDRLALTGVLESDPSATAVVTARTEGKIVRLTPNVGDPVAKDSVVAVVESEHLHEAQLEYALALKKLAVAEADLGRRRKLAGLGAYAQPGLDEARKVESEASVRREAARAEIRAADAAVAEARSRQAAQAAVIEQAVAAEVLAKSQLELAERQVERSQRLLASELVSRQEHEAVLAQKAKAQAENRHAQAEVRAAKAKLEELAASLAAAQARRENAVSAEKAVASQLEVARQALDRSSKVFRGGFADSREVSEAEAAVAQARISAEGALDDVQLLGGQPGDNHSIPVVTPFSGRVVSRAATLGQTVAAGEPILTVVDTRVLFAQLSVFPADLNAIRAGLAVDVTVGGRTIRGMVERIGDVADPATKAVKVRVRLENDNDRLRPGLPATALLSRSVVNAVAVPSGAVQRLDGKTVVFVPGESEGMFVPRTVEVGQTQAGKTRILSGLKPGEKFVSRNAFLVKAQLMKSELAEE